MCLKQIPIIHCRFRSANVAVTFTDDGIVHIQLLKRNRKGNYANGCTAADTFWFGLFAGASGVDRLSLTHPPTRYYSMHTL